MSPKKKAKPPRRLISHRTFAEWFGMSVRTWRRRYEKGEVPAPHQIIGTDLLYDRAVIDYRLEKGLWPEGVTFVQRKSSSRS